MKNAMLKTLAFTLTVIIVFTFIADAAQPNIPEWTKKPPENPNDLVKKLEEEGYEDVLGYPLPWVNSLASDSMPGLRGVVTATRTEGGKFNIFLVYYFEAEEYAKKLFEDGGLSFKAWRMAGIFKGEIVSSSDTVSISDPSGRSAFYRIAGKVVTQGNIENADTAVSVAVPKSTTPQDEQAILSWLAAPVQIPPKAVLSKSDIDIFVKNHVEIQKIGRKYSDAQETIENLFTEAFAKVMAKGDSDALTEAILRIRNFPVPAGLRSELSKLGLGENAFEKLHVILYGGGMYAQTVPMISAIPEYGSEEMEMALEENITLHGSMMFLGDLEKGLKAAIHENDMALISSRIADILPLLNDSSPVMD